MIKKGCNLLIANSVMIFTISQLISCDKSIQKLPRALSCEISYSDQKIQRLKEEHYNSYIEYGFTNNGVALLYNEKHDRGVVYIQDSLLRRLFISKQQFCTIAETVKNGSSIASLAYNKEFPLKDYLYITVIEDNQYIFYKIHSLTKVRPTFIDEAGYSSDREMKAIEERNFIACALGLGIPLGTLIFATGMLLWSRFALYMFAESK